MRSANKSVLIKQILKVYPFRMNTFTLCVSILAHSLDWTQALRQVYCARQFAMSPNAAGFAVCRLSRINLV